LHGVHAKVSIFIQTRTTHVEVMETNTTTSTGMRAVMFDGTDLPPRQATTARPVPGPGEVLVRIHASAVNPLDLKIHAGAAAHARQPLPAVLGIDLAGVVEAVGSAVDRFRPGDEVYGMAGGVGGRQGSLAEYVVVEADLLARKPSNVTMREAAALPLIVITAWEGLVDRARVAPGQRVLVHGGGGGVGHVAIQLAKAFGAEVFATDKEPKRELVERLGAVFIDSASETIQEYVHRYTDGEGFDIVFDTVGGTTLDASFAATRRFGHVVSALGWGTHSLAPLSFRGGTYSGVFTLLPLLTGEGRAHHGEILEQAAKLVEAGKLGADIDPRRFTLETADEAHRVLRAGSARGKLVVEI
jgi:NADPH:quinone reductase-like Zn-dependent oxidoreductase